jgi:hypothetical protein
MADKLISRKFRLFLVVGVGLSIVLVLVLFGLYWASRYEPAFYRKALKIDSAKLEKGSDEMLRRALAFQNNFKHEGDWQATFTAEQINCWLIYDLKRNHLELLQAEFRDPCVAIEPGRLQIGCLYEKGVTSSVLCLTVEPYVPEPNVVALRIVKARAGLLPLPLTNVLKSITLAAQNSDCSLNWGQADGDPVALISFPSSKENGDLTIKIKTVKLSEGEIFISGSTMRNK